MKRCPVLSTLLFFRAGCATSDKGLSGAIEEAVAPEYREVGDFQLLQQAPWQEGGLALVVFDALDLHDMAQEDCYGIGFFRERGLSSLLCFYGHEHVREYRACK